MFYIRTADKLQRTARWLEALPGGMAYLRSVILDDALGLAASLEAQMQTLVDSFFDEWAEALTTPSIASKFIQFANTPETLPSADHTLDRSQPRPVLWPTKTTPTAPTAVRFSDLASTWSTSTWHPILPASYFLNADTLPNGISAQIKHSDTQLAVFRVRGKYYATQQMCPHKRAFILSDSLVGQSPTDTNPDSLHISCPAHKRNFDLETGVCKNDTDPAMSVATFQVEERADSDGEMWVWIKLPPAAELDAALGTTRWMLTKEESGEGEWDGFDKKIGFVGVGKRPKKAGVSRKVNGVNGMNGGGCNGNGTHAHAHANGNGMLVAAAGGGCGSAPDW